MGEAKGEGKHLSWSEEGEHLKEKRKVRASFELLEKEEKAESGSKRGRLIAFY